MRVLDEEIGLRFNRIEVKFLFERTWPWINFVYGGRIVLKMAVN